MGSGFTPAVAVMVNGFLVRKPTVTVAEASASTLEKPSPITRAPTLVTLACRTVATHISVAALKANPGTNSMSARTNATSLSWLAMSATNPA